MKVDLNIEKNLKEQFRQLIADPDFDPNSGYDVDKINVVEFPGQLEFYHFKPVVQNIPIEMTSANSPESDWYLIHVNIGTDQQTKTTRDQTIDFHKFLPSGILMYCPGLVINTNFPAGHQSELVSFRFPKSFLAHYFSERIIKEWQLLLYEDLDHRTENKIRMATETMNNKLRCHALVLEILGSIFDKFTIHDRHSPSVSIHSSDIKAIFKASAHLRNPLAEDIASIEELAAVANMSATKFKKLFKQFFGKSPHRYHSKIKMEFAREELRLSRKTPVELSHALGFSHPSNFTTAYKKHFSVLPSEDFGMD